MSTVANQALLRRWFEEGMTSGDAVAARRISDEVFAADFVDHDGIDQQSVGRQAWQDSVLDAVFTAFEDVEVRIEHVLAQDDLVALRYVFTGTHRGTFFGVPATHRRIRHAENEIYRIRDGRVAESWGEGSWLYTLRQLGLTPQPIAESVDGITAGASTSGAGA